MRSSPATERVVVSPEDRKTLERWIRIPTAPQRLVLRSRIVLMLADVCPAREVARRLGVSRPTLALWRRRYAEKGAMGWSATAPAAAARLRAGAATESGSEGAVSRAGCGLQSHAG